jgi:serine/threonine protein phosphatase PrpC
MTTQWIPSSASHAARTDVGVARDHNEDRYLEQPPLFVVADGLGGHSAGEVAAQMLVDRLALLPGDITGAQLIGAIESADRQIYDASTKDVGRLGMSTTCVALLLGDRSAQVSHVGDSRAYRLRGGSLARLTEDHSVVGELVRSGIMTEVDAELDDRRHMLTQALGSERRATVTSSPIAVEVGDRYLLCSDGLSSQVPDVAIEAVLVEHGDPGLAADELVRRANAAGGNDNVTVIVVDAQVSTWPAAAVGSPVGAPTATPPAGRAAARRSTLLAAVLIVVVFAIAVGAAFIATRSMSPGASPSTTSAPSPSAIFSIGPSTLPEQSPSGGSRATPSVPGPGGSGAVGGAPGSASP